MAKYPDIEEIKSRVLLAFPIHQLGKEMRQEIDLQNIKILNLKQPLPKYYFIYLLFFHLLGFDNFEKLEKTKWSVLFEYKRNIFLIKYSKFGLSIGLFFDGRDVDELAKNLPISMAKAVEAAKPFFEWKAKSMIRTSKITVCNYSSDFFKKMYYFINKFKQRRDEVENWKSVEMVQGLLKKSRIDALEYYAEPDDIRWLAIAAIEAFFSWTEHIFIHLIILNGKVLTGSSIIEMIELEWPKKFKKAIEIKDDKEMYKIYNSLSKIKQSVRNFNSHGALGKGGEAFHFHSGSGAIPIALNHDAKKAQIEISDRFTFDYVDVIKTIESFNGLIWKGREPEEMYIQHSDLPLILTLVRDGTYQKAIQSNESMRELIDRLDYEFARDRNMDF